MDLSAAEEHGNLRYVFPEDSVPPPIEDCMAKIIVAMKSYRPGDYLLLAGDMDLVCFAAVLAAKNTGGALKLLKWHKNQRRYCEVVAPDGALA